MPEDNEQFDVQALIARMKKQREAAEAELRAIEENAAKRYAEIDEKMVLMMRGFEDVFKGWNRHTPKDTPSEPEPTEPPPEPP